MAVADTEGTVAIEAAAVRLLGSREHTRAELDRKLRSRFGGSPRLQDVLDDLERRRLLSDQRSAETFVERRSRKGYGPLRIRAELAARGVTDDRAAMALEAMVDGWGDLLDATAARKFGDVSVASAGELAKRGRFLERRGFPVDLIRRYLERVSTA